MSKQKRYLKPPVQPSTSAEEIMKCPECLKVLKLSNGAFWCETENCKMRGPVGFPAKEHEKSA